jgi:mono/diheme cytochrome c family protein
MAAYRLSGFRISVAVLVLGGVAVAAALYAGAYNVAAGAVLYKEMCSGCHLAPGMEATEISQGLYPEAPELSHGTDLRAEQAFWVIKHGVKMSGMAAWGRTHSDAMIWDLVAFLHALPSLSAADYQTATKDKAGHDHRMEQMHSPPDAHQGHSHQHE